MCVSVCGLYALLSPKKCYCMRTILGSNTSIYTSCLIKAWAGKMELAGKETAVFRILGFQKCFRLQEFHLANILLSV